LENPLAFVITIAPGKLSQNLPFATICVKAPSVASTPLNFNFLGATPPTVIVAPSLIPLPNTDRTKPPVSIRSTRQPVTVRGEGAVEPSPDPPDPPEPGAALHFKTTGTPCSL